MSLRHPEGGRALLSDSHSWHVLLPLHYVPVGCQSSSCISYLRTKGALRYNPFNCLRRWVLRERGDVPFLRSRGAGMGAIPTKASANTLVSLSPHLESFLVSLSGRLD